MDNLYARDEYEYRIGYQYKDGQVGHTEVIDERDISERLAFWRTHNGFLLLTGPWTERRRILPWERLP